MCCEQEINIKFTIGPHALLMTLKKMLIGLVVEKKHIMMSGSMRSKH